MKMPWGKYRGVELCFINSGYFRWLLNEDWFLKSAQEDFILAIEREMELRDMDSSHFYQDKVDVTKLKKETRYDQGRRATKDNTVAETSNDAG